MPVNQLRWIRIPKIICYGVFKAVAWSLMAAISLFLMFFDEDDQALGEEVQKQVNEDQDYFDFIQDMAIAEDMNDEA